MLRLVVAGSLSIVGFLVTPSDDHLGPIDAGGTDATSAAVAMVVAQFISTSLNTFGAGDTLPYKTAFDPLAQTFGYCTGRVEP